MSLTTEPVWDATQIESFLGRCFPTATATGARVTRVESRLVELHMPYRDTWLRPGGTVSGPVQMGLADMAFYVLLLAHLGDEALAVTTSLNFNFLRKPAAGADLRAEARLLKLGKRLAVGDVLLFSEGTAEPVAHAQVTYSRPPAR